MPPMARLIAFVLLQLVLNTASACRFARDAEPAQWFDWAASLFAAEVATVELDARQALDIITLRVVETFKGPQGAEATLQVPSRMWESCRLERPRAGATVLVALNAASDTLLVPLTESYREQLRRQRGTWKKIGRASCRERVSDIV
jgi:hypothetical protein